MLSRLSFVFTEKTHKLLAAVASIIIIAPVALGIMEYAGYKISHILSEITQITFVGLMTGIALLCAPLLHLYRVRADIDAKTKKDLKQVENIAQTTVGFGIVLWSYTHLFSEFSIAKWGHVGLYVSILIVQSMIVGWVYTKVVYLLMRAVLPSLFKVEGNNSKLFKNFLVPNKEKVERLKDVTISLIVMIVTMLVIDDRTTHKNCYGSACRYWNVKSPESELFCMTSCVLLMLLLHFGLLWVMAVEDLQKTNKV